MRTIKPLTNCWRLGGNYCGFLKVPQTSPTRLAYPIYRGFVMLMVSIEGKDDMLGGDELPVVSYGR